MFLQARSITLDSSESEVIATREELEKARAELQESSIALKATLEVEAHNLRYARSFRQGESWWVCRVCGGERSNYNV